MEYALYHEMFMTNAAGTPVREYATVDHEGRRYPLLMAEVAGHPEHHLVITAGFHGDEIAGPLTLLSHWPSVVGWARERDVRLTVFPCVNPSGFEAATRYNVAEEAPNNDFLRYETAPGEWSDVLEPGRTPLSHALFRESPRETRALLAALEELATPAAALDIHQDPWTEGDWAYAYTFGPPEAYRPLIARTEPILPVARRREVDDDIYTDDDGLIVLHDGSVTDYFHRRGTPFAVALETTTAAPLTRCHAVNLVWLEGLIALAAGAQPERSP